MVLTSEEEATMEGNVSESSKNTQKVKKNAF